MGRRSPLVVCVRIGALACTALALALGLVTTAAGQSPIEEKAAVDARIAALRAEIEAARDQEGVLTSQLSAIVTELQEAQAAVEMAQGQLDSVEA